MKKKKKSKGINGVSSSSFLGKKINVKDTMKGALIDTVSGGLVGSLVSTLVGKHSLVTGLGLVLLGNTNKDKFGYLRSVGIGTMAYGIAKRMEYSSNGTRAQIVPIKDRVGNLKTELLSAFLLDKVIKKKEDTTSKEMSFETNEDGTPVGSIDLSSLDIFDHYNQQEADDFNRQLALETGSDMPSVQTYGFSDGSSYNLFEDDEPDFNRM